MLKLFPKSFLPKSLLGRSLMIIIMPLVLLQVIAGYIFMRATGAKSHLLCHAGLRVILLRFLN